MKKPNLWYVVVALGLNLFAACTQDEVSYIQGYVEAEYVRVAAPFPGELIALNVQRGNKVGLGSPLFSLEQQNEAAARREAEGRLKRAQAQLEDLKKGGRPTEVDAVRAQQAEAEANLKLSEKQLRRQEELVASGFISKERVDEARAAYERDKARVSQLTAQLATTRLGARRDEIRAAVAEVEAAKAALAQTEWKLAQKSVTAPVAGSVTDTLYTQGEWVAAGSPIVTLLPPQNKKIRFFISEPKLGGIHVGQTVKIQCDGCKQTFSANISYIAPEAQFTPPVIFSRDSRAKLVFLVEARPASESASLLHPGQPVDVFLNSR